MPDDNPAGFDNLRSLVEMDEIVFFCAQAIVRNFPVWEYMETGRYPQVVC